MHIDNATVLTCQHMALMTRHGATALRVVVKGGFDILPDGRVQLAAEQPKVVMADDHWGDPGTTGVRLESDVHLGKPGTDLIVLGDAVAEEPVTEMDVALGYNGRMVKQLHVTGDRVWGQSVLGWRMSSPEPFTRMPVHFDRAYGGLDALGFEPRNPTGRGYATKWNGEADGLPVPNVEHPDELVRSHQDRPTPSAMGVLSRRCQPRLKWAGTYDDAWLEDRHPLLPVDFDDRYFHAAPMDQWIPAPRGGEQLAVRGLGRPGLLQCRLPVCDMPLVLHYRAGLQQVAMQLETVLLDANRARLELTWSTLADIHGDPFKLLAIGLGERQAQPGCCTTC